MRAPSPIVSIGKCVISTLRAHVSSRGVRGGEKSNEVKNISQQSIKGKGARGLYVRQIIGIEGSPSSSDAHCPGPVDISIREDSLNLT